MDWSTVGNAIAKSLPILGTVVGGPAGGAIGTLVASALGVTATPEAVNNALINDPDAILKLRELQANTQVQLQQLYVQAQQNEMTYNLNQFQAEVSDRNSACDLAAKSPRDIVRPSIAFTFVIGAIIIIALIFSGVSESLLKDPTASLTIGTVVGFWFNEMKQVMAFYFGTTRDANKQSDKITQFAVNPDMLVADNTGNKKNA